MVGKAGSGRLYAATLLATAVLGLAAAAPAVLGRGAAAPAAAAAPPAISGLTFSAVTTSSARLEANIDPKGTLTRYRFEYGTVPCPDPTCTRIPVPEGKVPVGEPQSVSVQLEELSPATTYHFRLIANNGEKAETPDKTLTTFAPAPIFGPCPANESLREGMPSASLPDCRAFEQASPIDKNGVGAMGRVYNTQVAEDGSRVMFGSPSGIPGAEGSQEFPTYLASRGPDGWSTEGLLAPQSTGQSSYVLGWNPELSETVAKAAHFGPPDDATLLARTSAGLTPIVPFGQGLRLGAESLGVPAVSDDGATVLFESKAKLLPAAIEGAPNLYAWDRETGTLTLAGALNPLSAPAGGEGASPTNGSFAGPYAWGGGFGAGALNSGGASASYYTQENHVLASDGSSAFFTTAGSGKLYRRQNPSAPQSATDAQGSCTEAARACTVQVSASERTEGTGPGGTDAAGQRPAAFMQASPDGSKVLFTSPEKLTDDATTGPEPTPPAFGRSNLEGEEVDTELCKGTVAKGVAVDAEHIYWADPKAGTIGREGLNCEDPEPDFITLPITEYETHPLAEPGVKHTVPPLPQYVAVQGDQIYWTETGAIGGDVEVNGKIVEHENPIPHTGTIGHAEIEPGGGLVPGSVKADFITGATNPQGIALDSEHIYWSNAGEELTTRTVGRATLAGGGVDQAFVQVSQGIQSDTPQGIAVDATHIYVGDNNGFDHYILRYDIDGNPASEAYFFVSGGGYQQAFDYPGLGGLAIAGPYLYWARQGSDAIGRIATADIPAGTGNGGICKSIPGCELEFIPAAGHPQGLAADGSHLYWSVNGEVPANHGNDLYRWSAEAPPGHHLSDLTPDASDPDGAEVQGILGSSSDTGSVYFVANGDLDGAGAAQPGDCQGTIITLGFDYTGQCSLYLAREGQPTLFVARLDAKTMDGNSDAADWAPRTFGGQAGRSARVSADGRVVIFLSSRRLTAYDNEGVSELYRYEAGAPGPSCVSCPPTGAPPDPAVEGFARVSLANINLPGSVLPPVEVAVRLPRNLSADGDRVFFQSTEALAGADTNGEDGCGEEGGSQNSNFSCQDAYEWEAQGTGSCTEAQATQEGGCLYLLSSGKSPQASFFAGASASGDDAFIATSEAGLVRQDQDGLFDIFDARIDGGLAAQNQLPPPICEGEASCRPQSTPAPAGETPASATLTGPGNPTPPKPKRCPKGKRRVVRHGKVRCVKRTKGHGGKTHQGHGKKHNGSER